MHHLTVYIKLMLTFMINTPWSVFFLVNNNYVMQGTTTYRPRGPTTSLVLKNSQQIFVIKIFLYLKIRLNLLFRHWPLQMKNFGSIPGVKDISFSNRSSLYNYNIFIAYSYCYSLASNKYIINYVYISF